MSLEKRDELGLLTGIPLAMITYQVVTPLETSRRQRLEKRR